MYYPPPSAISWAWYSPRYEHFVLQTGSNHSNFNRDTLKGLEGLLDIIHSRFKDFQRSDCEVAQRKNVEGVHSTLQKVWHIIEYSHLTWRDTVVHVADYQSIFLELYGMMDYYQLIEGRMRMRNGQAKDSAAGPRWIGAFTRVPLLAEQLYAAGVAVWLIREEAEVPQEIVILDIVGMGEPTDIVIHNYFDTVFQYAFPFEVLSRGKAGDETMHALIRTITYGAKDHGQVFVTSNKAGRNRCGDRTAREAKEGWHPCECS